MRVGLLTLLCSVLVTALPSREDPLDGWDGDKYHHADKVNVIKKVDGGVGGGVGVLGIGNGGGGGGCDPVACNAKVGYVYGYSKTFNQY